MRRLRQSAWLVALLLAGCGRPEPRVVPRPARSALALPRLGYALQAGAFAKVENAARFAAQLQAQGLDATYAPSQSGLFRVRFGDFPSRDLAKRRAEALKEAGLLESYWIVTPEEQPAARMNAEELPLLRRKLAETASGFLGVPYLWGGSTEQGFDCSGLVMAVYQLNGLRLPRSSQAQFEAGREVAEQELKPGDLVFFSANGRGRVSHVGVYEGEGVFIHAPSRGRSVCRDRLDAPAQRERFVGGRSFLQNP